MFGRIETVVEASLRVRLNARYMPQSYTSRRYKTDRCGECHFDHCSIQFHRDSPVIEFCDATRVDPKNPMPGHNFTCGRLGICHRLGIDVSAAVEFQIRNK